MPRPKKDKTGDQTPANQTSVATADAATPAVKPITMDEFMGRADRGDWLTIKQAADYLGGDPDKAQTVRNAVKNRAEFKADGATLLVAIEGYDIPPLTYVARYAIDTYRANNAAGTGTARKLREGKTRFILRITPEQRVALETIFATQAGFEGLAFEAASTPKAKKVATDAASPNGTPLQTDLNTLLNDHQPVTADQRPADVFETADQPN